MTDNAEQSEVEAARQTIIDLVAFDAPLISGALHTLLGNFETAIREESAAEIADLKTSVESWMWNFGILERETYDKAEQLESEIERLNDEQPTPVFQGTPTVEQVEAHAKAFPMKLYMRESTGGLWLRTHPGVNGWNPWAVLATVTLDWSGSPIYHASCNRGVDWLPLGNDDACQWLPLQPNGLPVGMSATAGPVDSEETRDAD